ncbi:MAG: hypothetical protein MUD14_15595 [Hydrococcus sp. Prado102]|nr:hypothetical protein [Hydrococcus sp. Prado102]
MPSKALSHYFSLLRSGSHGWFSRRCCRYANGDAHGRQRKGVAIYLEVNGKDFSLRDRWC